jgi:gliding motility-associated-like protein
VQTNNDFIREVVQTLEKELRDVLGNPSMGGAALQGSCTWPPSSANGNERGQGLDYYFKSSATKTMAQLDEAQNWNQATLPCYQIPAGDYKPIDPLSNLIGSDINGTWIMQVQDNTNNDDGTVLNWKLNLDPSLLGNSAITPIVSVHKWTAVSGSDITSGAATSKLCVTPTSTSNTDYKYEITDDFGCKKDTTIKITINNAPTVTGPTTICEGSTVEWTSTSTLVSSDISLATIAANGTKFNVTALKPTSSPSNLKITATSSGCSTEKEITINPKAVTTIKCGNPTSNSVTVEWTSVTPATGYNIEVDKGSGYGSAIPVGISSLTYDVTGLSSSDVIKFKISPTGPTGPCYLISNEITCKPSNCPKPTLDNNFPVDATVCADLNATASFKVVATSTPEPTYKWQKIVGTNPAVDLQNDAVFDGVDKNILNIKNISGLDGVKFQCIATETSGTGCNITSFAKTLKINPLPSFTPTALDICEGEAPVITYPSLTGNPDKIIFDPGIPPIAPLNLTLSASPFKITGLPVPLPVNTYSGFKVKLENSTTGCKSTDITIPAFKVQATQKPSISSKSTSINSVTFQWSDLTGLNTQTGTTKDSYTIKEFVCSGCTTPGTYVNGTGTLSYNSTTSKWEYLKNGLTSGDKVFIEVTPVDVAPLAIPSCYTSSTFELVAITCISPVITKDIIDISLCEGTTALPVSTNLSLEYNSADATTPATWEILTPGGTWSTLNPTGIYTITGSTNIDSKLSISDIKGLDGTKYRVNLKTATASGSCNTISHEAILTVKQLPVMTSITDKLFCPGTTVNDPLKTTKDIDFKVSQYGTPTFTWVSDIQTTGVSTGSPNVNDFASFTTLSPSTDVVSKITVTPTLNQCVGQPFSFNITVKPTVKPIFSTSVTDFSSVKFVWTSSSIAPDFWEIDTAVTNVSVPQPPLNLYKAVTPIAGTINNYTVSGINSTKKAYINVKAKKSIASNDLFCPVADGYSGIPTPCVKPTKPLTPLANPVCEGSAISVTGVLPDALADFQWKISTDGGTIWNNVSTTDFGSTGTTNVLTTTTTKTYMNNALVKLVLTDKLTGQCTEESDKVTLVINSLPTVKLIQPVKNSLCVDDNEVSATVQPLLGLSPMKVDYTMNGVTTTNKDIANLDIKFATSSETNHSLSIDKVTDANGCINLLTGLISSVSVYKNPTPAFTVSDTIGCLPLSVNFIDISGETYKDVTWDYGTGTNSSKDLGTSTFSYQKEGDYTVTYSVENMNGCKADIVIVDMIHVKKPPKAMISNDRNLINIYENVVRFDSKLSQNATFYRWDFGDNSSISNEAIVDHKYDPNSPGKFKVYLIVSNSPTNMTCSDTAITWIDFPEEVIYYIPNTFTPNGDEFNNTFQPIFSSGYDPQNYSFIIFDRWGQIVFESKNPTVGWDGTYGDKVLGNDTFVWKLGFKEKANDNEHYTSGHVNLVK